MTPWHWAVLMLLAALGGVVGSFLNVVIYRLPQGRSIVWPGSCCPGCNHPIRWYDNLPVISYFLLRARCRHCGMRISWRYLVVELAMVALFLLLARWEWMSGAEHLPLRPIRIGSGWICSAWTGRELAVVYSYHLMFLCTLFAAAWIHQEHPQAELGIWVRLFWPATIWGLVAAFIWPTVHPVPGLGAGPEGWLGHLMGLVDSLLGLAGGIGIGLLWGLVAGLLPGFSPKQGLSSSFWMPIVASAGLVGLYLGWQAALAVGLASGLFWMLSTAAGRCLWLIRKAPKEFRPYFPIPFSAWLWIGSLGWILFWKQWVTLAKAVF